MHNNYDSQLNVKVAIKAIIFFVHSFRITHECVHTLYTNRGVLQRRYIVNEKRTTTTCHCVRYIQLTDSVWSAITANTRFRWKVKCLREISMRANHTHSQNTCTDRMNVDLFILLHVRKVSDMNWTPHANVPNEFNLFGCDLLRWTRHGWTTYSWTKNNQNRYVWWINVWTVLTNLWAKRHYV